MARATYVEITCKSLVNRVQGMPFQWSANPYRGCEHDCQYCYARTTHEFLNLPGSDFAKIIQVKTNAPQALYRDLSRPGWKCETVALGTATDPYQPIEGTYRLTRRCLEVFALGSTPVSIVTKGTLVRRDIDVLQHLAKVADVHVCMSIPTIDRDIWRTLEPGTPPPLQRMRAVRALVDAGIPTGVFVAPVVPGLTTRRRHLDELVKMAVDHGAQFLGASVLHLKPGVRQFFLGYLNREHPNLVAGYNRLYRTSNADHQYQDKVRAMVNELKAAAGLAPSWPDQNKRLLKVIEPAKQLSLFASAS